MKTMINIRTIIVAVAAMLTISLHTRADEKLFIEYKDGSMFSYVLANKPKVIFEGNNITVTAPEITDVHKMENVKQFMFSIPTSVEMISADERRITYTDNETVCLEGFKAGGSVSVYDINGTLLTGSTVGKDGTVSISLGGLASGLYVIATTEGKSYKIIKR